MTHKGQGQSLCLQDASVSQSLKKNLSYKKMDGLFVYPRLTRYMAANGRRAGVTSCTTYMSCKSLKERFFARLAGASPRKADAKVVTLQATAKFYRHFFQKTRTFFIFLDINQGNTLSQNNKSLKFLPFSFFTHSPTLSYHTSCSPNYILYNVCKT